MIGRVYRWRGEYWRLLIRAEPFICKPGHGPLRNVLLERVYRVSGPSVGGHWWPTGELVVRPFRGLRRAP